MLSFFCRLTSSKAGTSGNEEPLDIQQNTPKKATPLDTAAPVTTTPSADLLAPAPSPPSGTGSAFIANSIIQDHDLLHLYFASRFCR